MGSCCGRSGPGKGKTLMACGMSCCSNGTRLAELGGGDLDAERACQHIVYDHVLS